MKQYFKRSTASLLCMALLMGLFAGVPGALITKASAATDDLTLSASFNFEDATDIDSLLDAGWEIGQGGDKTKEAFSLVTDATTNSKVLKWDNTANTYQSGGYGLRTPLVPVTAKETVYAYVDVKTEGETAFGSVWIYFYDADGNQVDSTNKSTSTNGEVTVHTVNKVAPDNAAYVRVMLYSAHSNKGVSWFDNIVIGQRITTTDTNAYNGNFAKDKNTLDWANIDQDFENVNSLDSLNGLGWNGSNWELVTETDGNTALKGTGSSIWTPLMDVRGMKAIQLLLDAKNVTALPRYAYFFDANGNAVMKSAASTGNGATAQIGQNQTATITTPADTWVPVSATFGVPDGAVYVMVMFHNVNAMIDNARIFQADVGLKELNYTFEDGSLNQYDALYEMYAQRWHLTYDTSSPKASTLAGTVIEDSGNKVLKLQRTGTTGAVTLFTPYMSVENLQKVTASADAKVPVGGFGQVFIQWYDAKLNLADRAVCLSVSSPETEEWKSASKTVDVPEGAAYAALMLFGNTNANASLYDNLKLACAHTYDDDTDAECNDCGAEREVETGAAALIRDGATVGTYETIAEALAAVQDGDTLKLLADITATFDMPAKNNVTFDGNGKTITGVVSIRHSLSSAVTGLTIKNVTFDAKGSHTAGYLVFRGGLQENLSILNCTFQNRAYISQSSPTGIKNLTISGCTFDGVANNSANGTAVKLSKVENLTFTDNTVKSVEWNVIQFLFASGNVVIKDNNIDWSKSSNSADGIFNFYEASNAKITIQNNAVTINPTNTYSVVYVQGSSAAATSNVALYLYDDLSFTTQYSDQFKDIVTAADQTIYCTGHTYTNDDDADCNVCGAEREVATVPAFSTATLVLKNDLAVRFYVPKALFENTGFTSPKAVFNFGGKEYTVSDYTETTDKGVAVYAFTFTNIAPHQAGETITYTLKSTYNGEEVSSASGTYSVLTYCQNKLSGDDAKLKTLVSDLLNYCAAVQTSLGKTPLVTDGLTLTPTTTDPTLESCTKVTTGTVTNPAATWDSVTLVLQDNVTIRMFFKAENIDGLSVEIAGAKTATITDIKQAGEYYYVDFDGLMATDMRKEINATVYNGEAAVSETVTYSVESYAAKHQDVTVESLGALVKAMMKYGDSAANYQ